MPSRETLTTLLHPRAHSSAAASCASDCMLPRGDFPTDTTRWIRTAAKSRKKNRSHGWLTRLRKKCRARLLRIIRTSLLDRREPVDSYWLIVTNRRWGAALGGLSRWVMTVWVMRARASNCRKAERGRERGNVKSANRRGCGENTRMKELSDPAFCSSICHHL